MYDVVCGRKTTPSNSTKVWPKFGRITHHVWHTSATCFFSLVYCGLHDIANVGNELDVMHYWFITSVFSGTGYFSNAT